MAVAIVYSRAQLGIAAPLVTIEVHLSGGLPALNIVGLPETAVKESKERVRSALLTCQFQFPMQRITVNLAPADLPKEGGRFDLPIALGILAASRQIPFEPISALEFVGELALTGELRPVRGSLPVALAARNAGRALIVPATNAAEAAMVSDLKIFAAGHLLEICAHLSGSTPLPPFQTQTTTEANTAVDDLSDVRAQHHAKRVLEIAAAGGHNLLMLGPPGTGKSMLARRLPSLLPAMTETEALETAAVASISSGGFDPRTWKVRPFRAPHHTASAVALVGGGTNPRPGEVSLAHNGVLFLDELPEYARQVLEVLREPLESGSITVSRAAQQTDFPARVQLIAAMNPCPCGFLGDSSGRCHCSPDQVRRYRARVSGPLLDRIDLHIEVPRVPTSLLNNRAENVETSATVRARVQAARERQLHERGMPNCQLGAKDIDRACHLTDLDQSLLAAAIEKLNLSMRAGHKILRVARTIADLDQSEQIQSPHLSEAIALRRNAARWFE